MTRSDHTRETKDRERGIWGMLFLVDLTVPLGGLALNTSCRTVPSHALTIRAIFTQATLPSDDSDLNTNKEHTREEKSEGIGHG